MAEVTVQFRYLTGLKRRIFRNARLVGSWDQQGRESPTWSDTPMTEIIAEDVRGSRPEDGCPGLHGHGALRRERGRQALRVVREARHAGGVRRTWGCHRSQGREQDGSCPPLPAAAGRQQPDRGVLPHLRPPAGRAEGLRAAAPRCRPALRGVGAQRAERRGRLRRSGHRLHPRRRPRDRSCAPAGGDDQRADGIWQSAVIPHFAAHEGLPYMYRITNAQGHVVYRTDFSRQQIGRGTKPEGRRLGRHSSDSRRHQEL